MNIQLNIGSGDGGQPLEAAQGMNILIVGNFSGKNAENRAAESSSSTRDMLNIDPLNLDAAMRKLQPMVSLGEDDNPLTVNISTMDDFHPDRLFASQPAFAIILSRIVVFATSGVYE